MYDYKAALLRGETFKPRLHPQRKSVSHSQAPIFKFRAMPRRRRQLVFSRPDAQLDLSLGLLYPDLAADINSLYQNSQHSYMTQVIPLDSNENLTVPVTGIQCDSLQAHDIARCQCPSHCIPVLRNTVVAQDFTALPSEELVGSQKMVLPIIIHGLTIDSRADSGSEDNIMSRNLISHLKLRIDDSLEHHKQFRLANGNFVSALGRISIKCAFAKDPSIELCCTFYIFDQLISPIIMGMAFLDETETLVKYRHRLQPRLLAGTPQLCSLNNPRCRLLCIVDSLPSLANADTGSDMDLMSLAYVRRRGFVMTEVDLECSTIEFADATTALIIGKVDVPVAVGGDEGHQILNTFYVLEELTCDVLLSEEYLFETNAFERYRHAFSYEDCDDDAVDVNAIMWVNTTEKDFSRLWNRHEQPGGSSVPQEESKVDRLMRRFGRLLNRNRAQQNAEALTSVWEGPDHILDVEMCEQLRREEAEEFIASLPEDERAAAAMDEERNIHEYERRQELMFSGQHPETADEPGEEGLTTVPSPSVTIPSPSATVPSPSATILSTSATIPSPSATIPSPSATVPSPSATILSTSATVPSPSATILSTSATVGSPSASPVLTGPQVVHGRFKCGYRGCAAQPFQTQYLLNSHENVHSTNRPHYCPVDGCPRSKVGKGFRRKNEMIRHGLVHEGPGYICPFCPEREHKYPRPDNLQRHVRVNHTDRDTNDPALRDALAQRLSGTGRRR